MKKVLLLTLVMVLGFGLIADAQVKKIALIGRISWAPGGEGSTKDTDFDIMQHFSMSDVTLSKEVDRWGYFSVLMVDYVIQYMMNEGVPFPSGDDADYWNYVNDGIYMSYPTYFQDEGYACVWNTGTCWSTIGPALKNVPVPVIQGEHVNLGDRSNKLGSTFIFFSDKSGDIGGEAAKTLQLTEAGKTHPLTSGFPDEFAIYGDGPDGPPEDPGQAWQGIYDLVDNAGDGTVVLAVWASDPTKAAIAVVEKGAKLSDDTLAPARRVKPFYGGGQVRPVNGTEQPMKWVNVVEYMTPEGKNLMRRSLQWAMGEEITPVSEWSQQ